MTDESRLGKARLRVTGLQSAAAAGLQVARASGNRGPALTVAGRMLGSALDVSALADRAGLLATTGTAARALLDPVAGDRAGLPAEDEGESVLAGLGSEATELARAVAVLGGASEPSLAADLAGLTMPGALACLDVLVAARVLDNHLPLGFTSPALHAAALAEIPLGTRIHAHLRAAELLRDAHAGAEQVGAQLLQAGPAGEPWAVAALEEAAAAALERGDSSRAADYVRQIPRERVGSSAWHAIRRRLCRVQAVHAPGEAIDELRRLLTEAGRPADVVASALQLRLLLAEQSRCDEIPQVLDEALGRLGPADVPDALGLLLAKTTSLHQRGEVFRLTEFVARLDPAEPPKARESGRIAALRATAELVRGDRRDHAVRLATDALAGIDAHDDWDAWWHATEVLVGAGEFEHAEHRCAEAEGLLPQQRHPLAHIGLRLLRAQLCLHRGDLPATKSIVDSALAGTAQLGLTVRHPLVWRAAAMSVHTLIGLGRVAAAAEMARASRFDDIPEIEGDVHALHARGRLRFAQGDPELALADQLECGRRLTERRLLNPAILAWRTEAVGAYQACHLPVAATELAEENLAAARAWGAGATLGPALRTAALTRSGAERVRLLAEALPLLESAGARLELAHAHHAYGETNPETGAESHFRRAAALARLCGAAPLTEQARDAVKELRPTGGQVPLTAQERKVAKLVRDGYSNKQIASELFLARRTVEFHLSGVYRKLGISGRRELVVRWS